ncbi:class I SAM-dependent methyltransferase [Fodinibius saliphilus]|uniref:class I SAM-dependent methyltransferase n=1 Tax=Fodinibius saliphilus TaxID=1920650 RepID=UPI001109FD0A|nr:class I SAM-dependent methyltransferase [Fodinibius saliphilus]
MLSKINRYFIPKLVTKRVRNLFLAAEKKKRIHTEKSIEKVRLASKHISNCELLLDRSDLLIKLKENAVVGEIGVANGDFTEQIIEKTQPEKLHLIDNWDKEKYNDEMYKNVRSKFSDHIKNKKVIIHRKLSTEVVDEFPDNYFDWIYLDTSHRYQLTKEELFKYSDKVKPGGIISGHDYSMGNWVNAVRYGVIEATHEFCVKYDWELIYLTVEPIENQSFALRKIKP